jgi:hypothetical protein
MIQAAVQWWQSTFGSSEAVHQSSPMSHMRTVTGTVSKENDALRNAFFSQPDDPNETRTHLQDRMQSGGA